jgi:non-specific serine/threonine protein kinase
MEEANAKFIEQDVLDSDVIFARAQLAMALVFQGDLERATALCTESGEICHRYGERWALSYALYVHAFALWWKGETASATSRARECLDLKHAFLDRPGVVIAIELLALIAASAGEAKRAAKLWGAAQTIWVSTGRRFFGSQSWQDPHRQHEARAREALGDDVYDAEFRSGIQLTLDEAVAYAVGRTSAGAAPRTAPAQPDKSALTRRESQVAELIAQGLSNREIASTLQISVRTAELHVSHILEKLGFASRTRIVVWAAAHERKN